MANTSGNNGAGSESGGIMRYLKNPIIVGILVVVIVVALFMSGVIGGKTSSTTVTPTPPSDTTTTPSDTTTPTQQDALPGAISDVRIDMSGPDDEGATTEAYTNVDQMEGVSVSVSFVTPTSSFGYGTLKLKEYIISLGDSPADGERGTPKLVIAIPRETTGDMKMVSSLVLTGTTPNGVELDGDFNQTGQTVTINLGSDLWTQSGVFLDGKVYLGIDYTTMGTDGADTPLDFSTASAADPVTDTQSFLPDSEDGVALTGDITDTGSFVIDPDVQDSVDEALNIQMSQEDVSVGGGLEIRKTIGLTSRLLISPITDGTMYWGPGRSDEGRYNSIIGTGAVGKFDKKPSAPTILVPGAHQVWLANLRDSSVYYTEDSNWFNYAITKQRDDGWVRLALISNFEDDVNATRPAGVTDNALIIKDAQFPVLHTLTLESDDDDVITLTPYTPPPTGNAQIPAATWFKFVSPLDGSPTIDGGMSICIKRVGQTVEDITTQVLSETITTSDLFLVREGNEATVMPLTDISDLQAAVFTTRPAVDGSAPVVAEPPFSTDGYQPSPIPCGMAMDQQACNKRISSQGNYCRWDAAVGCEETGFAAP